MARSPFVKPAIPIAEQIALLRDRGLSIDDEAEATHCLKYIGYYRLSGYMLPFQNGGEGDDRHIFNADISFGQILDLASFDRRLRLLFLDAIERIEIAIRAAVSTTMSLQYGPHWFLDPTHFDRGFDHADFLNRAKSEIGHNEPRRRDVFIEHYYTRYSEPEMPPSWMLFEALPFGIVSMATKRLDISRRKRVAHSLNIPEPAMKSWPHCLSYVRNLCAHHSRLWNRTFTIKPFVTNQHAEDLTPNDRLYAQIVVMQILMRQVSSDSRWPERVANLLVEHPDLTPQRLSFPPDWQERPIWR